ncbi:MAG TPA: hypothetical protein VL527_11355 [Dongiaceae bacterium]|nr:hypothetical protein [Dongiaceae bacterium]
MYIKEFKGWKTTMALVWPRWFAHHAPTLSRPAQFLPALTLALLLGGSSARAQSTAAFSISGVIPATQHLELSPIATSSANPNQLALTLTAQVNVAASYTVTLQSRATNNLSAPAAAYQLSYNGHPLTLASGKPTVLPVRAHQNSVLQISRAPAIPAAPLALTIISQ